VAKRGGVVVTKRSSGATATATTVGDQHNDRARGQKAREEKRSTFHKARVAQIDLGVNWQPSPAERKTHHPGTSRNFVLPFRKTPA
jgi:hypothetical protein